MRVAVIGAGPGIGLAVARRFAREDFEASLVCRMEDTDLLKAALPCAQVVVADLTNAQALEEALVQLEPPEVLVYNASRGTRQVASALMGEHLDQDLQVNLRAPLRCAQWVAPFMKAKGRGTLLFTGGGLALAPKAEETSLSIGKAALRQLSLCLAQEWAPEGLHVATVTVAGFVQPGPFSADFVAEAFWQLHAEPNDAWTFERTVRPS